MLTTSTCRRPVAGRRPLPYPPLPTIGYAARLPVAVTAADVRCITDGPPSSACLADSI